MTVDDGHRFGSEGTIAKLDILEQYLKMFTDALKKQPFKLIYIDAFAGTGRCDIKKNNQIIPTVGSARRALRTNNPFDAFYLIDKNKKHIKALQVLKSEYPSKEISILEGDANDLLKIICAQRDWQNTRGILFLDPYGCEVEWETLVVIANTKAIDVWYLFPFSGLYRQASHDVDALTNDKAKILTRILGTEDWRKFYKLPKQPDLYNQQQSDKRAADHYELLGFASNRLKTIFLGGVAEPKIFYRHGSKGGPPMRALYFAVANPDQKASRLAMKFANHVLKADD